MTETPTPQPQKQDDRLIAGFTLDTAFKAVMQERADQHGDAENSFAMIAELWEVYLDHTKRRKGSIGPVDVAHMMALLKIARSIYGDPTNNDHYADGCGYEALAAMLSGAIPAQMKDK